MALHGVGDGHGRRVLPLHPHDQCAQAAREQEDRFRGDGLPEIIAPRPDGINELFWAHQRPRRDIAVPAQVFGSAVDDDIRPQGEWLLVDGRAKGIVYGHQGPVRMGQRGYTPDIDDFEDGVRGCFEEYQFRMIL